MTKRKYSSSDLALGSGPSRPEHKKFKAEIAKAQHDALHGPMIRFPSRPELDELKREAFLYDSLGSETDEDRTTAAVHIVYGLEDAPEDVFIKHLENRLFRGLASSRNASRLGFSVVITELLRQLFGPKNTIMKYPSLTFERLIDVLVKNTQITGSVPGQEKRDAILGRVFGLQAFVESGILSADADKWTCVLDMLLKISSEKVWLKVQCGWIVAKALQHLDKDLVVPTLEKLATARVVKTPEGLGIWLTARDTFPGLKMPQKPWQNPLAAKHLDVLVRILKSSKVEDEGAELAVDDDDKEKDAKSKPKVKQGIWSAQLHFVWDVIIKHYAREAGNLREPSENGGSKQLGKDDDVPFDVFWKRVVDDGLFSVKSSDHQRFTGFSVLNRLIALSKQAGTSDGPPQSASLANPEEQASKHREARSFGNLFGHVFSNNLVKCLIHSASDNSRYLNAASLNTLASIENLAHENSRMIPVLVKALLGKRGEYYQPTVRRTINKCLQYSHSVVPECLSIVRKPIMNLKDDDGGEVVLFLQAYAEYLNKLAVASNLPPDYSQKASSGELHSDAMPGKCVLDELLVFAYSQIRSVPAIDKCLTPAIKDIFRSHLEQFMLSRMKLPNASKLFPCEAVDIVLPYITDMDEELSNRCATAVKTMHNLQKECKADLSPRESGLKVGLAQLHAAGIFQLLAGDSDAANFLDALADLMTEMKDTQESKNQQDMTVASALVELIFSLLVKKSGLTRHICTMAFTAFGSVMDADALQELIETLFVPENENGFKSLFRGGDDEDDSDTDDDDDDDEVEDDDDDDDDDREESTSSDARHSSDSLDGGKEDEVLNPDLKFENLNKLSSGVSSPCASDICDSDSSNSSAAGAANPDRTAPSSTLNASNISEIDNALAALLKTRPFTAADAKHDTGSPSTDSSASLSDMTDSQMLELDSKLVEVFRQRRGGRTNANEGDPVTKTKQARAAADTVIDFKRRVLDLLEIFIRKFPLSPLTFGVLPSLLIFVRAAGRQSFTARVGAMMDVFARECKKKRATLQDDANSIKVDEAAAKSTLTSIYELVPSDETHAFAQAANKAAAAVATLLVRACGKQDGVQFVEGLHAKLLEQKSRGEAKTAREFVEWVDRWKQAFGNNDDGNKVDGTGDKPVISGRKRTGKRRTKARQIKAKKARKEQKKNVVEAAG